MLSCFAIATWISTPNLEPERSAAEGQPGALKFIKTAAAGDRRESRSSRATGTGHAVGSEHALVWRVVGTTGPTRYRHRDRSPADWQAVSIGLTIEPYAEIQTGADGRLELSNGQDHITLAPNSRVALIQSVTGSPDIKILQSTGQANYEVEPRWGSFRVPADLLSKIGRMFLSGRRPSGQFEVQTPFLVATVKGTAFVVEVEESSSSVDVEEGSVHVTASRTGLSALLTAGERATVSDDRDGAVSVEASPAQNDDASGPVGQSGSSQDGDSQGDDSQGDDSQGDGSQGDDSQGDDSQGDDSQGDVSQGDVSQGDDSQGDDSQGGDSQGNQR